MKNLIFLLSIIAFFNSCKGRNKQDETKTAASAQLTPHQIIQTTLNGIDSTKADSMIKDFSTNGYKDVTERTSIWFSKDMVQKMVNMLEKERKAETRKDFIDGIRFYFVTKPGKLGKPIVALVSTRFNGIDQAAPSKAKHKDYYEHDAASDLFSVRGYGGVISHDNSNEGAVLYVRSGIPDDSDCDWRLPYYLKRDLAERMVTNYAGQSGRKAVNTASVWYSLDLFKNIEAISDYDGIRLYFATFPSDYVNTAEDGADPKKNRDTFVITTTIYNKDILDYLDDFTCKKSLLTTPPNDNGELCPTHCN